MSIPEIILSADFILALFIYILIIVVSLPLLERIHAKLENPFLEWQFDHVGLPLFRAAMMMMFLLLAYPVIFAVPEAPPVSVLMAENDLRINYLVNLLFVISLLFPLVPVNGNWHELILPMQGIAASIMIFSWFAASLNISQYSYWPGWKVVSICIIFGIISHWLAIRLAQMIGHKLDKTFNVLDSGELFSRGLILLMQSPVILIFSSGLGKQLVKIN